LLSGRGVDYRSATLGAARAQQGAESVDLSRRWRVKRFDPPFGIDAVAAMNRAHRCAARLGLRWTGTTHLLAALLSFPDGAATRLLLTCGADTGALAVEVSRELGVDGLEALGQ
jgi:hypothetical protein